MTQPCSQQLNSLAIKRDDFIYYFCGDIYKDQPGIVSVLEANLKASIDAMLAETLDNVWRY